MKEIEQAAIEYSDKRYPNTEGNPYKEEYRDNAYKDFIAGVKWATSPKEEITLNKIKPYLYALTATGIAIVALIVAIVK